ncbi:MAG: hypothetical protein M1290_04170 [Candidatus Thermoplasmatota archaeon]|jgi:hypothetical protein|nr:hypothetical protein [Candidatus Thermoplasmatota archaeon]
MANIVNIVVPKQDSLTYLIQPQCAHFGLVTVTIHQKFKKTNLYKKKRGCSTTIGIILTLEGTILETTSQSVAVVRFEAAQLHYNSMNVLAPARTKPSHFKF